MDHTRTVEQLDRMVAAGRITAEEANRLRATAGTPAFDAVVATIRARHAHAHTETAVAAGTMTPEAAAAALEQVRRGDHSADLRRRIRGAG